MRKTRGSNERPENISNSARDLVRRPAGWFAWWGLPILAGVLTNFLGLSLAGAAFAWAGLLAWMGTGCLLNAWRCSRLHCFTSGPVLWLGAVAAALVGVNAISGAHALNDVVWITIALALLSFIPEAIWGKYARR